MINSDERVRLLSKRPNMSPLNLHIDSDINEEPLELPSFSDRNSRHSRHLSIKKEFGGGMLMRRTIKIPKKRKPEQDSTDSEYSQGLDEKEELGALNPAQRSVHRLRQMNRYFARNEMKLCYGQSVLMSADKLKFNDESGSFMQDFIQNQDQSMESGAEVRFSSTQPLRKKDTPRYALHFHDYLNGSLQYAPQYRNQETAEINSGNFLFQILPLMLYNSRKRVQTQISRIQDFLKQLISSRRIDDQDSIRRNVTQLMTEINDNMAKLTESQKTHVKYGDRVMIVHVASGLFLKIEPRFKDKLTMKSLLERFKPFRLTVTSNPDKSSIFQLVPVYKHKGGHTVRQDQPLRLGYIHQDPIERLFLLEGEYESSQNIMLSEDPKGSMRLQIPVPRLNRRLSKKTLSYHGAIVQIYNKEARRFLSLTVRTNQERIFTKFKDIRKKLVEKQADRLGIKAAAYMDVRTVSNRMSFNVRNDVLTEQEILTETLNKQGQNKYTLIFNYEHKGNTPGLLWQIIFLDQEIKQDGRIHIFKVWLRHLIYNSVIGPLYMHLKENEKRKDITVRFQTTETEGRFINIDGELSKKSEQFQFTKLVSLKPNPGKRSPTESLTLIKADQDDIRVAQFLSSVHRRIKYISQERNAWGPETVDEARTLVTHLKDFVMNNRSDLLDKAVPLNSVSVRHQEIIRESQLIRPFLNLYEALNQKKKQMSIRESQETDIGLVGMLKELIELIRSFVKKNTENIKMTVIYLLPVLVLPATFKEFPIRILKIVQQVLGHLSNELFETVEKSILLFLRLLLRVADREMDIYHQLPTAAKIELMITLKAYARILTHHHNEDQIRNYFHVFVGSETYHPQIITNKFHTYYTRKHLPYEDLERNELIELILRIDSPQFVQEQFFFYTEVYPAFLLHKKPQRLRLAGLIQSFIRKTQDRQDEQYQAPVLSGMLRIMRHSFQNYKALILQQPVLLRIESKSGEILRQNQISNVTRELTKLSEMEGILSFDDFNLFGSMKATMSLFLSYKARVEKKKVLLRSESNGHFLSKYHVEMMRIYNSILSQPGLIPENRRSFLLTNILQGYLEVCRGWMETMSAVDSNPYDQKLRFPLISSLQLQILRMQIESQIAEMKMNHPEQRFLTQGVENVRNYLNHVEACYDDQLKSKRTLHRDEASIILLKRYLTRNFESENLRDAKVKFANADNEAEIYFLQEEAWEQMIKFFNIVIDIDADCFLDSYVMRERKLENIEACNYFVRHNLVRLMERPEKDFYLLNRLERIAPIIEALFSWLPLTHDATVLRKNLNLMCRLMNLKQELRSLMMQSTFLPNASLKVQSLQQIQYVQENLLEIDQLVKSSVSHWKSLFKTDLYDPEPVLDRSSPNRADRKEEVIERMLSLLDSINGFFSLFNPFGNLNTEEDKGSNDEEIDTDDLSIASKIFKVIHGHEVILNMIISMQDLLSQALQRYSTTRQIQIIANEKTMKLSMIIPQIFTMAYRIIAKFTKFNADNKEIMVGHLVSLLPTYGAMFQIAMYCKENPSLKAFHDSFVKMYISIFHDNTYIVYASKAISNFMEKFNLRVVYQKFTISCKIYAQILQNSSDPALFDLAFSHLKAIKRGVDEAREAVKSRVARRSIKLYPEELAWNQIKGSFYKMMTNLQSPAFKVIRVKIEDFYYILRAEILLGVKESDFSVIENSGQCQSIEGLTPLNFKVKTESFVVEQDQGSAQDLVDQPNLVHNPKSFGVSQTMQEKIASLILSSPQLQALVIKEKELMYSIIFQQTRTRQRLSCKTKKKKYFYITGNYKKTLKGFLQLRNNQQAVLDSKLLFYLTQLIKVLEAQYIFKVSPPQIIKLQILQIYFIYRQNSKVARKLETKVVGLIAHFFVNKDSISLQTIIPVLLEFANYMLNNGSRIVQDRFYEFFRETSDTNIFSHVNEIIRRQTYNISTKHQLLLKNALFVKNREFQSLVLKDPANESLFFLKSLCENHHAKFQKFIRDQGNEDKNYDMIDLTVDFLYGQLLLIQQTYFNTKRLKLREQIESLSNQILSSLPFFKNFDETSKHQRMKAAGYIYRTQRSQTTIIPNLYMVVGNVLTSLLAIIEYIQGPCLPNQHYLMYSTFLRCAEMIFRDVSMLDFFSSISPSLKISQKRNILEMKSQCALILISIVQGRNSYDSLSKAIKTEITIRDIEFLIAYTYYAYCRLNNGVYVLDEQYFGKPGVINWYRLEAGFNFYFLMRTYFEQEKQLFKNFSDSTFQLIAKEEYKINRKGTFREIRDICKEMFTCKKGGFVYWKSMAPLEVLSKRRFLSNYEGYFKDAVQFYKMHSAQVEIHHLNGTLETVYFPKAPSYYSISKSQKERLIFNLSADNDSLKVDTIMRKGTSLIEEMDRRYYLHTFFLRLPVLGIFFSRQELWNFLAFWLTIVINFLIIFSYSEYPRRTQASLLISIIGDRDPNGQDDHSIQTHQKDLIEYSSFVFLVLGLFLVAFIVFGNLLTVFESFVKHVQDSKRKHFKNCIKCERSKNGRYCQRSLFVFWGVITDYLLLYTMLYVIFAFLGVIVHPFYFAFHITAIFSRSPELQNILNAIWRPWKELLFTLIFFMMAEYIFALMIYQFYNDEVKHNHCISLATCILTVLDQTFKNDGGVGGYLDQNSSRLFKIEESAQYPGGRILFHQFFNFVIIILLVQVLAAILIDTFGKMRQEKNEIQELVTSTCLICGKERDEIERNGEFFDNHVKKRHNMFNYILFIAYLRKKNPIDYTGVESYVYESYLEQDWQFFPIYKEKHN